MKKILVVALSIAFAACSTPPKSMNEAATQEPARATASSEQLGRPVWFNYCGGKVTLNQAANDDLSIQFEGVNTRRCDYLTVSDNSSRREIKQYEIKGTSYTLSKKMLESLSDDCQVNFRIHPQHGQGDSFIVYIPWCRPNSHGQPADIKSYQLSGNNNCKLMINSKYSGRNVDDSYCEGARNREDVISYEWSRNNNCKRMINGDYSNINVADKYCK